MRSTILWNRTMTIEIDPINLIVQKIIEDAHFDSDEWCIKDAERLEQAAELIRDGLNNDHP
jgi:hypothetical protein